MDLSRQIEYFCANVDVFAVISKLYKKNANIFCANVDVYAFISKCGVDPVLVAKSFSHVARLWYSRAIYEDWYSKQICSVICKQICVGVFKQIYLD